MPRNTYSLTVEENKILKVYMALNYHHSKEEAIKNLINTDAKKYVEQNLR